MKETDLNRIVYSSFRRKGNFGHKISDDAGSFNNTSKKPFDGFAVDSNYIYFAEGKLLKTNLGSFAFNRLEDHQIQSLTLLSSFKNHETYLRPLIYVGWYIPRKLFSVAFLHIDLINYLLQNNKESILKKEWLKLQENLIPIKSVKEPKRHYFLDVAQIEEKIIGIEKWKNMIN